MRFRCGCGLGYCRQYEEESEGFHDRYTNEEGVVPRVRRKNRTMGELRSSKSSYNNSQRRGTEATVFMEALRSHLICDVQY